MIRKKKHMEKEAYLLMEVLEAILLNFVEWKLLMEQAF